MMENAEEIMHLLEEFSKLKPKDIPRELEEYLGYVAKTGDPVFKWSIVKCLFREKLVNVITEFYERTLTIELPPCPNVDPFNYERMKANLLEKLDTFGGAPFTIQRICELLTNPWKEYKRADKFMRAVEKNILVVSTREPGRNAETDTDSQQDTSFNGVPELNDSAMETSFSCNDLPDADSSSQSYEINSQSQSAVGLNHGNLESLNFKESEGKIGASAASNELGILRNDEVSQEIVIGEKESDTVICSIESHVSDDLSSKEVITETEELVVPSVSSESSPEDTVDSNTPDCKEKDPFENKEAMVVEVTNTTETVVDSLQIEVIEVKESANIVDSSIGSEKLRVVSNSNDSSEESSESSSSHTFEDPRPTECDTSNSFDSETSNSCDSEGDSKNTKEQLVEQSDNDTITKAADSTETDLTNEAAPACSTIETDAKDENTEQTIEPDIVTAESIDMEVGECQISLVDQSES